MPIPEGDSIVTIQLRPIYFNDRQPGRTIRLLISRTWFGFNVLNGVNQLCKDKVTKADIDDMLATLTRNPGPELLNDPHLQNMMVLEGAVDSEYSGVRFTPPFTQTQLSQGHVNLDCEVPSSEISEIRIALTPKNELQKILVDDVLVPNYSAKKPLTSQTLNLIYGVNT